MRVLQFGSDSSAHALAWKLINSTQLERLIVTPGNAAIALFTDTQPLAPSDPLALMARVLREGITLAVADAQAIASGLVDELQALPVPVCGARQELWALQASRCAAYEWFHHHRLPVARGRVCTSQASAEKFAASLPFPIVIAADDARGPVRVCTERIALPQAIAECLEFTGQGVLVQERPRGPLVSVGVLSDGETGIALPATRLYVEPAQPFAPPVGAHAAATRLWTRLEAHVQASVREPLLRALRSQGSPPTGWISVTCVLAEQGPLLQGLALVPHGLEAACVLLRLGDDLLPLLQACAQHSLATLAPPHWSEQATLAVAVRTSSPTPLPLAELYTLLEPDTLTFLHNDGLRTREEYAALPPDTWAIVASAAPTLEQARERVYRSLQRLARPGIVFAGHIGTHEL